MTKITRAICVFSAMFFLAAFEKSGVSFQNVPLGNFDGLPTMKISGSFSIPKGKGPFPAVVLLHTCGGMTPHVSDDWPYFLNKLGYATLAVDTFGSRSLGRCPNALNKDLSAFTRDAHGALAYLATRPDVDGNRVGVMGFSLGAFAINDPILSWRTDNPGKTDFKAAVAMYGRCGDYQGKYTKESLPLMEIVGDKDKFGGSCERWGGVLPDVEVHILPGVHHAFDSEESDGRTAEGHYMSYDSSATDKARELTKAFFAKHLGK